MNPILIDAILREPLFNMVNKISLVWEFVPFGFIKQKLVISWEKHKYGFSSGDVIKLLKMNIPIVERILRVPEN